MSLTNSDVRHTFKARSVLECLIICINQNSDCDRVLYGGNGEREYDTLYMHMGLCVCVSMFICVYLSMRLCGRVSAGA